ncbi:bifunctional PIG-L family deacetylase/class I SAM-dependent methyltransferase [Cryobacterium psychrophilum]|uniref:Methyltransferase domain-containing protein n=1 Tax=Cryobacterium psychrophilum TaxID=41988 RepID=A0A4Y8KS69_9MICO|nr:bifunctional PIG-L family deacetylase/class I SAM-dependent methyltransferase [Cryobacterium psychrophilum]TDW29315.1 LmbE family N-acetylglucosaminyl deacetylase [Cryobacterium psychrophilum]TFD79989.1 methyltransferase domain-containing protein [Cryobacterium psychrophilum]
MVTFGRGEDGTPERVWAAAEWRAALPELPLHDLRRLVVVAAHPYDEALGAGGLIARVAAMGLPISVLVLSNGDLSNTGSSNVTPERLAAIRRIDVMDTVAAMAPEVRLRLLELPDGLLSAHVDDASQAIATDVGESGPGTWIVAPWRADGQPDHMAAGQAAVDAAKASGARLFEYPIWAWHWSTPTDKVWPDAALRALDLTAAEREAKAKALGLRRTPGHESHEATGDEPIFKPEFSAYFTRRFETFIEADVGESLKAPFPGRMYSNETDPQGGDPGWYERRKRALTMAVLPREHFSAALELGCSTGVLTSALAGRCTRLLALDGVETAVELARARLAGQPHVTFEKRCLPLDWPDGTFDLIVLSEVAYFCSTAELGRLLAKCRASLTPDGVLLACNRRHPVREYPLSSDHVHTELTRLSGLQRTVEHREKDFLLDVFEPRPARSVAEREGLVG